MTWKEFKEGVDKRIEELGLSEDTEIRSISVTHPDTVDVEKWQDGLWITE